MRQSPAPEFLQRIEAIEGRPADEALRVLYIDQGMTILDLCARWSCGNRRIMQVMHWAGVTARDSRERVRIQWQDNPDRRRGAAAILRKTALAQSAAGRHNRLGKTKETDAGVRAASEKLKGSTSATRPEVRSKMAAAKCARYLADPSAHPNARANPTQTESDLLQTLGWWGYHAVPNHCLFPYWLDVFIPCLSVGIECFGTGRHGRMTWARHAELCARGVRMLYISNRVVQAGNLGDLYQYLAEIEMIGPDPAPGGQKAVIWGCRDITLFSDYPDQIAIKRAYLGGLYRLDITAPAEDPIPTA